MPISRLPEVIAAAERDVAELGLIAPICGHVGDGNFHLCILSDPADGKETRRIAELNDRLVRSAHAAGDTCAGEQGSEPARRGTSLRSAGQAWRCSLPSSAHSTRETT